MRRAWDTDQRRARLRALAELHHRWSIEHEGLPVPDRPGSGDVAVHHVDAGVHPDEDAEFSEAARAIFP